MIWGENPLFLETPISTWCEFEKKRTPQLEMQKIFLLEGSSLGEPWHLINRQHMTTKLRGPGDSACPLFSPHFTARLFFFVGVQSLWFTTVHRNQWRYRKGSSKKLHFQLLLSIADSRRLTRSNSNLDNETFRARKWIKIWPVWFAGKWLTERSGYHKKSI